MDESKKFLCYVDGNEAYFCDDVKRVTGDDWDDSPASCNAGGPYCCHKGTRNGVGEWAGVKFATREGTISNGIVMVYWAGPFESPAQDTYSVDAINRGAAAWLFSADDIDAFGIVGGCSLTDFRRTIIAAGGCVSEPSAVETCDYCWSGGEPSE